MTNEDLNLKLAEIEEKMKKFDEMVSSFAAQKITPLSKLVNASIETEQAELEKFQEMIKKLREERYAWQSQKSQFEYELKKMQAELNTLRLEQAETIQLIAAQEKMQAIEAKFAAIIDAEPWMKKLHTYQMEDVLFTIAAFEQDRKGVLNANDMGLGKTVESAAVLTILTHMFYEKENRKPRILWLTMKGTMKSTLRELRKWGDQKIVTLIGTNADQRDMFVNMAVANNAMLVANYESLATTPSITNIVWDFVIMDEVHKLKGGANSSGPTKIFQNTRDVCQKAKFILPLSGTPIQNHPKEMWSYLHLLDPIRFPNVRRFEREYCFGWPEVKVDVERIISVLKGQVIRRKKQDVYTDLPDKEEVRYVLDHTAEQSVIYNQMRDKFFVWLDEQEGKALTFTAVIAQLTYLRQANIWPGGIEVKNSDGTTTKIKYDGSSAKFEQAMEIVEDLVALGEQVIIWTSQFKKPVYKLADMIREQDFEWNSSGKKVVVATLTGDNSDEADAIAELFRNGDIHVLIASMKVGGVSLNLGQAPVREDGSKEWEYGASNAIFLDRWWNPAINVQAEDRIWGRGGATNKVLLHVLECDQSVDAFIAAKLQEKEHMITGIMDNQTLNASDWKNLLKEVL